MAKKNVLLGDFLIQQGLITEEQLKKALRYQEKMGKLLGQSLVDLGFLGEKDMIKALSQQLGVQYVSLRNYRIDPEVVKLVSEDVARTFQVLPLFRIDETLTVGMVNPLDVLAIDAISRETGLKVEPVVCIQKDILEAINLYYGSSGLKARVHSLGEVAAKERQEKVDEVTLRREAEEGPVVQLVNLIIAEAVKEGASDIHIEPREKSLRVRYRVDGILYEAYSHAKNLHQALVSRIKILAELNIAERRLPQDGRFQLAIENREVDFRVSVLPTAYGENVVLRILDKDKVLLGLEDLGLSQEMLEKLKYLLAKPHGIILTTGPTGSGKTTTLYASLLSLDSLKNNIMTLEDPIEYRLDSIRQSQVNPKIGWRFANGLRTMLRQDPDIIMVGEIRDRETAEIAVQSALTGHLVLSTLHTNDAPGALTRLVDMGVEPYLIASATQGVIAQRLVRKICPKCKESYQPSPNLLKMLGLNTPEKEYVFYRGKGCSNCRYTGYKGRIGIYEILVMDEKIRDTLLERADSNRIKRVAQAKGMKSLREDGLQKALMGITSVEEVVRVTQLD